MNHPKFASMNKQVLLLFLAILLFGPGCEHALAFAAQNAYINLYSQKTEILLRDGEPVTRTKYEIVFSFPNEKAIAIMHNYSIYYSYFDHLENLEAYTKNPRPDGKVETIKIRDFETSNSNGSGVFYDDQQEVKINFLGLVAGSEAHVEYTITTAETHFTDPMIFRYYLPIEKEIYELTVPSNVKVSFIEKNMPANFVQFSKKEKRNETIYTWLAEHVDEEKMYDNAPARIYYTPHILYKIEEYTVKGKAKSISKSPRDLFEWYVSNVREVNKNPSAKLQVLADSITRDKQGEAEKVKAIYNWVKSNIRYVAFENGMEGLVPREAESVYQKKYGDCKDMSSLLFGLLNAVRIPAHLTWIGTRHIPYTYSEVPMKNTDNHMIAAVKVNAQWVFLDATDPNGIYGLPSDHIQGKQALIYLNDTSYELAMVPVVDYRVNAINEVVELNVERNDLNIKAESHYSGMMAGSIANELHYMTVKDKEDFAKSIVKRVNNNAILKKHVIPAISDDAKANISVEYRIPDYVREVANEKFINLYLEKEFMNDRVSDEKREAPVNFKYNSSNETTYILHIPPDYKVSYVPGNASFHNDHFNYAVEYRQEPGKLICKQQINTNFPDLLLKSDEFNNWNQFVKGLNNTYKESVILEKIK